MSQPTVIIVDDDPLIRMQACGFLSQAGFTPTEAADGREALEIIPKSKPELIILDVEMPGLNGFEVCRAIRQQHGITNTPILMLTGLNDKGSIDAAYAAGATDFSTKPINWSLLCHRLRYMHRASMAAEKIHLLAYYDTITNLPNRALLLEILNQSISNATKIQQQLAVLCFDLDDFKRINDGYGHDIGDKLLKEIGNRLNADFIDSTSKRCKNVSSTVARMGGDEFAVLLRNITETEDIECCASYIIEEVSKPLSLEGYELFTSASIGIAVYPDDTPDPESLLKNADMAMYEAKRLGKNTYAFHDDRLDALTRRRLQIDTEIRQALSRNEFSIHYQPQLDLTHGVLYCAEALLRWNNPSLGDVPPEEFISVAEDNGMIVAIGEWVLRSSCTQAALWHRQDFPIKNVAVNVSALQFMKPNFIELVRSALQDSGLSAASLELEITESLLASNINHAVDTLNGLKELGVQLSIDDFGTGFSSLSQLKEFPIDRLKIDRSFIHKITEDKSDSSITKAVIAMSKSMEINVLAEGVETAEQLEYLIKNGCNEIQGYYISEPQTAEALEDEINSIQAVVAKHFSGSRQSYTENKVHPINLFSNIDRKAG